MLLLTTAVVTADMTTVLAEGTLTIALGANNPAASAFAVPAEDVPMLQLRLSASAEETLAVTSITVKADGTGDDASNITELCLWRDVNLDGIISPGTDARIAQDNGFGEDDGTAEISIGSGGWGIPAGTSQTFIVAAHFAAGTPVGETYRISVVENDAVIAMGRESETRAQVTGAPLQGNDMTTSAEGVLTIAAGECNPPAGAIPPGSSDFALLQLRLCASNAEPLAVTSVTVTASGTADDTRFIRNLKLWKELVPDGELQEGADSLIATVSGFSEDNGTVTFDIGGDGIVIPAGSFFDYLVTACFPDSVLRNETYRVSVPLNSDVIVTNRSGEETRSVIGAPVAGNYMTAGCGPIATVRAGSQQSAPVIAMAGQQCVQVAQIRLTDIAEDLTIESLAVHGSGTGDESSEIERILVFHDANADGVYEAGIDVLMATANSPYESDNGSAVITLDWMMAGGSEASLLIAYDIALAAQSNDAFQVAVGPADLVVTGIDGAPGEVSGSTIAGPMVVVSGAVSVNEARPLEFGLSQNAPNPFNPVTTISFTLPQAGAARLVVCNTAGQIIRTLVDGQLQAGVHTVTWDARDDAGRVQGSGIYLCRLEANQGTQVRRMTLVR